MSDFNVCSSSALNVKATHGVTLKNENSNDVIVDVYDNDPSTWPFAYPDAPFTIPAKTGSQAGVQGVVVVTDPGTYYYATDGCPNGPADDTNPKTVIIS